MAESESSLGKSLDLAEAEVFRDLEALGKLPEGVELVHLKALVRLVSEGLSRSGPDTWNPHGNIGAFSVEMELEQVDTPKVFSGLEPGTKVDLAWPEELVASYIESDTAGNSCLYRANKVPEGYKNAYCTFYKEGGATVVRLFEEL